jgi:hypothetical protein
MGASNLSGEVMSIRNLLIAGDLMWALSGDPATHPTACDIIGAAVKAKVKAKVAPQPKPKPAAKSLAKTVARTVVATRAAAVKAATPAPKAHPLVAINRRLQPPAKPPVNFLAKVAKVAKSTAKKTAKTTAQQRAQVAKQRLATRPPAKVAKAKVTAAQLKSLPPPAQRKTVAKMAELTAKLPAATSPAPDFLRAQPTTGPDYSPAVTQTQPWDLPEPTEPAEELSEEFQDVADAVWADQAYDAEVDAAEEPEDDGLDDFEGPGENETEEPADEQKEETEETMHENEIDELGVDLIGWNPFKAIKSAVQKGAGFVSKVAKSNVVKATAAGLAIVYPPVGAPLSTTLPIAAGIADAVKSKDPKKRAAAVKVVKNTAALAKKGDKDAGRALSTIAMMTKLKSPTTNDAWKKAVIKALAAA